MLYCSWECSNDKVVRSCASIEPLKSRCRQQGVFKIFQYTSIQYVFRLSPRFRDFWPFSGSSTMTHRWNALTVKFTTKSLGPRPDVFLSRLQLLLSLLKLNKISKGFRIVSQFEVPKCLQTAKSLFDHFVPMFEL